MSLIEVQRQIATIRDALDTVRPALKWIANHAPEPDEHALAGHAAVALTAVAEAEKAATIARNEYLNVLAAIAEAGLELRDGHLVRSPSRDIGVASGEPGEAD
jgi:hypothetical protein